MIEDKTIVLDATKEIVIALIEKGHSISTKTLTDPENYEELHSLIREIFTTLDTLTSR